MLRSAADVVGARHGRSERTSADATRPKQVVRRRRPREYAKLLCSSDDSGQNVVIREAGCRACTHGAELRCRPAASA